MCSSCSAQRGPATRPPSCQDYCSAARPAPPRPARLRRCLGTEAPRGVKHPTHLLEKGESDLAVKLKAVDPATFPPIHSGFPSQVSRGPGRGGAGRGGAGRGGAGRGWAWAFPSTLQGLFPVLVSSANRAGQRACERMGRQQAFYRLPVAKAQSGITDMRMGSAMRAVHAVHRLSTGAWRQAGRENGG